MKDLVVKDITNNETMQVLLEQYKLVITSLDNTNQTRESLNTFWISSHSIVVTALAFFMNSDAFNTLQKHYLLWVIVSLGAFLSLSWIQAISTIIRTTYIRNQIIIKLEQYFPANVFTAQMISNEGTSSTEKLSIKEIQVPIFFLLCYLFLCGYMIFSKYGLLE